MKRTFHVVVACLLGWCALATVATAATPKRGWAHEGHVVDLQPSRPLANQSPLDRSLVAEAFARWGIAYDEGSMDVIASLFTEDASFAVSNGSAVPFSTTQGRDKIVTGVASVMKSQGDQRRHLISNVVIDRLTDTEATAIAYGVVVIPDDPIYIGSTVIYSADLRKEDGVWRFSRLFVGLDKYEGPPPH